MANKLKVQFELSTAAEFRGTEMSLERNVYTSVSQTLSFANVYDIRVCKERKSL